MSVILGINSFHAGASAALVVDGKPVAAVAEERLNRIKYYAGFPARSIEQCLAIAGLEFKDIQHIAIGRSASSNRLQKAAYALRTPGDFGRLFTMWRNSKKRSMLNLHDLLKNECALLEESMRFTQHNVEHHLAHIASSYYISRWEDAAGFSADGSGDFVTCMFARCTGPEISVQKRVFLPHSLGLLYTAICQLLGYSSYGDEGKIMGLAALGNDTLVPAFDDLVKMNGTSFALNLRYFIPVGAEQDNMAINAKGEMVLGRHFSDDLVQRFGPPPAAHSEVTQREMDLAYALQDSFEKIYLKLLTVLHAMNSIERIAIAGGCALNSVANGKIFSETPFRETCIQPAAGDDGLALGAALYVSNAVLKEGKRFEMTDAFLGPSYTDEQIEAELSRRNVRFVRHARPGLLEATATALAQGEIVGWFQGRMEWGPRALGNRSVLAHPGRPDMKDILNARIKRREWYRPFAPSVLAERQTDIFEESHPSPFMLHVYKIKPSWQDRLPAVNHVDNTGRIQTITAEQNPLYYDLIKAFEAKTGIPLLLNTSFNENEPIVCTPAEAIDCYLRTNMDVLSIGSFFCTKTPA